MKSRLLVLGCSLGCWYSVVAQEKTLPAQGEIAVEGKISAVQAGQLILLVQSFTLPNGKTSVLPTAKAKTILSSDKTVIHVRGDATKLVKWAELKPQISAIVIGEDKGAGAMPGRSIQVWQGVKDGVYLWPAPAKANDKATGKVPQPTPVTAAENGPPPEKPGALANVLEAGDFEGEGHQAAWKMAGTVPPRWEKSGKNHWLSLESSAPQMWSRVSIFGALNPAWKTVRLSAQVKVENLKRNGSAPPRFNWVFFNEQNKPIQDGRGLNLFADTDWKRIGQTPMVPKGATGLEISASLRGATGRFSLDNLRLEPDAPVDLQPLREGFPEGTFSSVDETKAPQGFRPWTDDAQIFEEDNSKFLRLVNTTPNRFVGASMDIALPREWTAVKFRARLRVKGLVAGPESWNIAKIGVVAIDEWGQRVGPVLGEPKLTADSDWAVQETTNVLPPGTVGLRIEPSLLGATGVFDVDDLQIEKAEGETLGGIGVRPDFTEGTFEQLDEKGFAQGWTIVTTKTGVIKISEENGNHFLHMSNPAPGKYLGASGRFKLPPDWRAFTVRARLRATNLQRNDPNTDWKTARVGITFLDARGAKTGGWSPSLLLAGNTDWKMVSARMDIPRQAAFIVLEPMIQEATGDFDIDDVQFEKAEPKVIAAAIYDWTRAFPEGTFERQDEQGNPIGWEIDGRNARIEKEEDNHFLRLSNDNSRNTVLAQSQWRVLPQWRTVRVRARLRAANLKTGANPLDGARFQVLFSNADEEILMPLPPPIEVKKDTDWVDLQTLCPVPKGATVLKLLPSLSRATGTLDIDDVIIEPVD